MPSIKLNAIANYAGQGFGIVLAIVCMPLYLQYLGAESYGLVGFFMIIQNWLSLLDQGLAATLGRQVAVARGQINGFKNFNNLLRSFEIVFFILAISIVMGVYFESDWIAHKWLKANLLSPEKVAYCISIMGIIIGLKLFSTTYRSGINGFEDQIWINKLVVTIASLKYIGTFFVLVYITNDVAAFFEYQLAIAVLEVGALGYRFYDNLPASVVHNTWFKVDWRAFRGLLPFTLSITYTSAALIIITQFDKLLLSGSLSLQDFGYFSLITLLVGGIISLSTPVFLAFLPRMTMLASKLERVEMQSVYVDMTQIMTWITFTSTMLIIIFPQEILYLITGDNRTYQWGGGVLLWYALGSGTYVLGTFQYYLQNALGNLKLYVIGSTLSLVIQVPLIYFVVTKYGAIGAGQLWFIFTLIWFFGWTAVVHSKYIPGFHIKWLVKDLLPIIFFIAALAYLIKNTIYIDINGSRTKVLLELAFIGIGYLLVTSASVPLIRNKVFKKAVSWWRRCA